MIAVICCVFNPVGFSRRISNYWEMRNRLCVTPFTIEAVLPGQQPQIPDAHHVFMVENQILWQKERLLTLLVERLPDEYDKVVWMDCDLVFDDDNWLQRTAEKLDDVLVVQPFEAVRWQDENGDEPFKEWGAVWRDRVGRHAGYTGYGWPGYAMAARRELFDKVGLYDANIIGGGDVVFTCGCEGDCRQTAYLANLIDTEGEWYKDLVAWAERCFEYVQRQWDYIPGEAVHLWHGQKQNRDYDQRFSKLSSLGYNPKQDVFLDENGLYTCRRPDICSMIKEYFRFRREDSNGRIKLI